MKNNEIYYDCDGCYFKHKYEFFECFDCTALDKIYLLINNIEKIINKFVTFFPVRKYWCIIKKSIEDIQKTNGEILLDIPPMNKELTYFSCSYQEGINIF